MKRSIHTLLLAGLLAFCAVVSTGFGGQRAAQAADDTTTTTSATTPKKSGPAYTAEVPGNPATTAGKTKKKAPPACPWTAAEGAGSQAPEKNWFWAFMDGLTSDPIFFDLDGLLVYYKPDGTAMVMGHDCHGNEVWKPLKSNKKPSADQLEPYAGDRVSKSLEPPAALINPVGRAPVNLGLWLAADPFDAPVARAQSPGGAVWWETTATVVDVTFDMGNGDRRTCTVYDNVYQNSYDTADESPNCGYTYRGTEVVKRDDLVITIVARYRLSYANSDGGKGDYPAERDLCVTTLVPYDVYELKTVPFPGSTTTLPPIANPIPLFEDRGCPAYLPPR